MGIAATNLLRGFLSTPWLRPLNDAAALDDLLGLVRPTWSLTKIRARVIEVRRETVDVTTLVLAPNSNWPGHVAGQHVAVEAEIRGRRVTRTFSLSSPPRADGLVAITVKRRAEGNLSRWWNERASVGDVVTLSKPAGEFVLPANLPPRLAMISAGSGITPLMSMLRDLDQRGAATRVLFVHAARSRDDVIFHDELRAIETRCPWLELRLHYTSESGRFDDAKWRALASEADAAAYLCGPAEFMKAARAAWRETGREDLLRTEHFGLRVAPDVRSTTATVTARKSGTAFESIEGRSLLESAESAGLRPANGCRMGVCHTCVCRKVEGTTVDLRSGRVSSEPGEIIQLCVTAPLSPVTIDL